MARPTRPTGSQPWGSNAVVTVLAVACLLAAAEALGCPNCKDAVNTSDPDGMNVARGYFYSILIMLAMPCTLLGSFGAYVWREMQRQKRTAASTDDGGTGLASATTFHQPGDTSPS